ncbi:MAG: hypothetical protein B7O98_05105 [Zestosphaera tikiterensis]|uniref:Cation efflux protein transmembrane domain-containing protein n=1 Tax=Zestosphaera tikiterensis TaxID=1973259 RepID=A0A2R7Y625_9CREN|nr:MAG: hypothetical protein B7O98_05105 [Zestosphaera tikiterensis]
MRAVYISFVLNLIILILKVIAFTQSKSSAVDAEFLHALGNAVGSGMLVLGLILMNRRPSFRYPFGFGRGIYVAGLISASIVGGFLFSISLFTGLNQLKSLESVYVTQESLLAVAAATFMDFSMFVWAFHEFRKGMNDPSTRNTLVENLTDCVGDVIAVAALTTVNPLLDAVGALIIAAILLISSISLGFKYAEVLIGRSAPKNVLGRAVKVVLSDPRVVDVNDVKSLVIGPNQYLLLIQVEVPENLSVEEINAVREELVSRITSAEQSVKHVVIEFYKPTEPPKTFKEVLKDIITLSPSKE